MILAVDIGNTNITAGLFRGDKLLVREGLVTAKAKEFKAFLNSDFSAKESIKRTAKIAERVIRRLPAGRQEVDFLGGEGRIEAAVVCSVVPKATVLIKKAVAGLGDIPIYVLGQDLIVPIKNLYGRPRQVGQDRLSCAWAAMRLYGAPVIVVDLGTAITFDAVSKNREYLGGVILPGLRLSLNALHQGTALLPQARLGDPPPPGRLIGKDTRGSILSGMAYGFGALIDGLVKKFRRKVGEKAKVVLTGGDSRFIRPYCAKSYYFEPDLILTGLKDLALWKKNAKKT